MKKSTPMKSQATISSFFPVSPSKSNADMVGRGTKRPTEIDLTLSDQESESHTENAAKKRKMSDLLRGKSSPVAGPSRSMDDYRFTPNISPNDDTLMESDDNGGEKYLKKSARRDMFRKKVLVDSSIFSRDRQSSDTQLASDIEELQSDTDAESELNDAELATKSKKKLSQLKHNSKSFIRTKKAHGEVGPSGKTYTPLEKQIRALKLKYPDTVLMVEVGYKYRFFGEDAKIASKELGIVCYPNRNFLSASIPVHRKDVHLKKLLSMGHKIGIVGQLETAALKKVSDNRNAPFERELTHLYTAATFVAELDNVDDPSFTNEGIVPSIVSIFEKSRGGMGGDERISISLVAVTPSTGDVVWDEFEDGFMRSELETRLVHIKPSEVLLPEKRLSAATEKMLQHFSLLPSQDSPSPARIRIERSKINLEYSEALESLTTFYTKKSGSASKQFKSGKLLATITNLLNGVTIALAYALKYLTNFGLADVLTRTEFFSKFTERHYMLLNANTLVNLEIYHNQTDHKTRGSLIWILDRTKTKFGARLLRSWVGRPLIDKEALKIRTDAMEELLSAESTRLRDFLATAKDLLKGLPDLARGLCRIQYRKCSPKELAVLLRAFDKIANAFSPFEKPEDVGFESSTLNDILFTLPKLKEPLREILGTINLKKATEDVKADLWIDTEKYSNVTDAQMGIMIVESELEDELKNIRKVLHKPAAKWTTVAGEEFLIEVKKDERREIPIDWVIVSRYHTPIVKQKLQERARYQEMLEAEANAAFWDFLREIIDKYYTPLRNAVDKLAILDCLASLATVASFNEYCRPTFVDNGLEIVNGRHPMIEALRSDPFVPNSIQLGNKSFTKIITGPNMGGKSSAVRMVALIAIMAQIGSYVPATVVKMELLDAVLTRMGASDELARGRSTFMVEMSETSDILRLATPRSLIILDELGRGTSTFDGMAIASAVLQHIVKEIGCKTLFITHYPLIAVEMEWTFPASVANLHMAFSEESSIDGSTIIAFLYQLKAGIAAGSFGIECGRLAGLPDKIVENSSIQAALIREKTEKRRRINRIRKSVQSVKTILHSDAPVEKAHNLKILEETMQISEEI